MKKLIQVYTFSFLILYSLYLIMAFILGLLYKKCNLSNYYTIISYFPLTISLLYFLNHVPQKRLINALIFTAILCIHFSIYKLIFLLIFSILFHFIKKE